jgi:hypothetical protein
MMKETSAFIRWFSATVFVSMLLSLSVHIASDLTSRLKLSDHWYQQSLLQLQREVVDYSIVAAYQRSACRLNNGSALYWNDLGNS